MSPVEAPQERIARQLREAVNGLHAAIDRVEFWADTLDRLAQPIPDYQPSDTLSRHLLPGFKRDDRAPPASLGQNPRGSH